MIYLFANFKYGLRFIDAAKSYAARTGVPITLVVSNKKRRCGGRLQNHIIDILQFFINEIKSIFLSRRISMPVIISSNINSRLFNFRISNNDHGIVAGFNQIFRNKTINRFKELVNFHPSILPLYKGPVPSYWCISNKEKFTGYTLHKVTDAIDNGLILYQESVSIDNISNESDLDNKIAEQASKCMLSYLDHLVNRSIWSTKKIDSFLLYKNKVEYKSFPQDRAIKQDVRIRHTRRFFGINNASAKNFLVQWIVQRHLLRCAKQYLRGRLIDVGCGSKPYAALLAPFTTEHVGIDHLATEHGLFEVDIIGSAYELPVAGSAFDSALYTAVLEHLEEPEKALRECFRILKPGGVALFSVPFIWHLHEPPRDFYRFSKYGLEYLLNKTGFETLHLIPLSGFWTTFGQLFVYNIYRFNRRLLKYIPIIPLIGILVQLASYLLDCIDRTEQWTWMYLAVARKSKTE